MKFFKCGRYGQELVFCFKRWIEVSLEEEREIELKNIVIESHPWLLERARDKILFIILIGVLCFCVCFSTRNDISCRGVDDMNFKIHLNWDERLILGQLNYSCFRAWWLNILHHNWKFFSDSQVIISISYVYCTVDQFTKKLFWNFKQCQLVSMEACLAEQMSEKNFVPNIAPSLGSGIIFLVG